MNNTSRTITGIVAFVFGIIITISGFRDNVSTALFGIPLIIIAIIIFFNKKEDEIEQVKSG